MQWFGFGKGRYRSFPGLLTAALTLVGGSVLCAQPARANDGMFPAAPAARTAIDFDGKGFLVHGKRTFIVSAGLEYARIPRALWRDRLLKIKRAGFNCVEIYIFWNFHEPHEGEWNFSGDHDLDAFLKLVHDTGLYATVRVGPYVCAEWDSGGYPVWLRFKPGLAVREENPIFQAAVDKYFDKVIPIVAANQINHGGAVVMVQLENEHPKGWGTEEPNEYFRHLQAKALSLGLEVPYFFSGLHHSADPAGDRPWDSAGRTNPWYSTEFWCDWYNVYGQPSPSDATKEDRATWKIIAYGGNGYNYYMFHGGTNFDHFNSNEDASSYDYGSAIGQAGDLRPIYYKFKRAAQFATSFPDILENSTNTTESYQNFVSHPAVHVTARTSPAGTIVFLDNPGREKAVVSIPAPVNTNAENSPRPVQPSELTLAPGEIVPVLRDAVIAPGVTMDTIGTRVLGVLHQGNAATVVCYGPAAGGTVRINSGGKSAYAALGASAGKPLVIKPIPGSGVTVVYLTEADADRTFFVESDGGQYLVTGADYVGDFAAGKAGYRLVAETNHDDLGKTARATVIAADGTMVSLAAPANAGAPDAPKLSAWKTKTAALEAAPAFDDHAWKASDAPLAMGADGDDGAFAWYRTSVTAPSAGNYTLRFGSLRDRALVWLDGAPQPETAVRGNGISLHLSAGAHQVALFTAHYGRDKLFGLIGPIDTVDAKGLTGPARLQQTGGDTATLSGWKYQMTDRAHRNSRPPAFDAANWQPATIGADVFDRKPGYAWYETILPAAPAGKASGAVLHFESVDDNGTIFVNGTKIGYHEGWNEPFDAAIPASALKQDGTPNVVAVLVQNTDNTGGLSAPVTLATYTYDAPVTGWRMRGGTSDPLSKSGWTSLAAATADASGPRLYQATFTAAPPAATGIHPILRATFENLSHGFMYLNGHNLGRYPERVPIDAIYLPECWLDPAGHNTLTVLDEDGKSPEGVRIVVEARATRAVEELRSGSIASRMP